MNEPYLIFIRYEKIGRELIAELCRVAKEFDIKTYQQLLKQAQRFSVNVFPNVWKRLQDNKAVHETQPGEGIYYLAPEYYSKEFGLSEKPCNLMELYQF